MGQVISRAVKAQSSSPGTQQNNTNINVSGTIKAGTSVITDGSVIATSNVSSGGNTTSSGFVGATTNFQLNGLVLLDRGGTFPTSGLADGQRYFHTTYRAWFMYNSTDALWRQEAPGVFGSSFPTVASGDNTVAPKIEVKRSDLNNTVFYYDGTRWLSVTLYKQPYISRSNQPFAQAQTFFDTAFVDYASGGGVFITKISANVYPVTAQSGTNFYTLTGGVFDTSGAQTNITLTGGNDTKAMTTANSWRPLVPTFTPIAFGTTFSLSFLVMTPTAAPGTFYMNASIQYQLVG